jgi:hypothetical protein
MLGNSVTYDEPIYVGASMHWTALHDDRAAAMLYHPPLAYHLIDLPLRALDVPLRPWDPAGANTQVGLDAIYGSASGGAPVAPETVILLARMPVLLVGLLGLPLMFALGRRLGGTGAGWLAAAAWTVFPEAAAQSIQATTDCVAAIAALGLAVAALRHVEAVRAGRDASGTLIVLGLATGIALLAKHTLLVHVGVVATALVAMRALTVRRLATAGAIAFLVVWAGYTFEFRPAVPAVGPHETLDRVARALGVAPATLEGPARSVPLPAPTYLRSVLDALFSKATARSGTLWTAYLDGTWDERGFWLYFPLATIVKTPVVLLLMLVAGLVDAPRRIRERPAAAAIVVLLLVLPAAAAVVSRLNIGFRHLLPTLPFGFALGAATVAGLAARAPRAARWIAVACGLLLAHDWAPAVRDPIPFANAATGGPARLHRRLADSNLEMGQDLRRVRAWAAATGVEKMTVVLHGPPGLYERECARDALFEAFEVAPTGGLLSSIRAADQQGPVPRRGLLVGGESVMVLPRWRQWLLDLPPLAQVGRARVYALPR